MRDSRTLLVVLACSIAGACAGAQVKETPADAHPHWGYTADDGPAAWGHLSPEFAACASGTSQSPIDLTGATVASLPSLGLVMDPVPLALENNGHTVQQNVPPGSILEVGGQRYALVQFHVHHPSEHTVNGQTFPLEIHFVHRAEDGRLAVVGVFVQEGAASTALAPFFDHLPAHAGERSEAATSLVPAAMLPADRTYFNYSGSLTAPPCSEGVAWYVMKAPVTASSAQIAAFSAVFPLNARPVEPRGKRSLDVSGAAH
jgi:carbonic anhydrase